MRLRPSVLPVTSKSLALAGLFCGAFLAALPAISSARAEPVSATYEVYFGGFHVLNAEALWVRGSSDYRLLAEAETRGFVGWLNPWKGTTESNGRIAGGKVIPQRHVNWGSATDEGEERIVALSYDRAGDITESLVQPEQDWEDRHPLPADAGRGTLDPLSVIAGLSELLQKGGRCEGSFAVFDGRKRYDLTVSDAGERELEPTDYSIYAGPAHGCRLDYEMLGGHRMERNKYVETARERIVWVARPAENAPLIPVRLEIETAYGTLMGHLTGFAQGLQAEAKLAE
ncbi:DUF3108 domain-containing protein [Pelagibius sp. 7325]|uniref:DUF3108 domain-containing protein n=1 Tax=Pelagibius sp. 7325 TaxID=3131994 RepID=UPI0030ED3C2B